MVDVLHSIFAGVCYLTGTALLLVIVVLCAVFIEAAIKHFERKADSGTTEERRGGSGGGQ